MKFSMGKFKFVIVDAAVAVTVFFTEGTHICSAKENYTCVKINMA